MSRPRKRIFVTIFFMAMFILLAFIALSLSGCSSTGHRHDELEMQLMQAHNLIDTLLGRSAEIDARFPVIQDSLRQLRELIEEQHRGFAQYAVPDMQAFADVMFDFRRPDIKARLDEAISYYVNRPAFLQSSYAAAWRYFPMIEKRLAAKGLHDDFKYVAIVESGLKSGAQSQAKAAGPWQFIPWVGERYGLEQNETVDMRRSFEKSTDAAIDHFQDLRREFGDDIPLSCAANNLGSGNLTEAMEKQGVENYFDLHLPTETAEYFFRIVAIKLIFENPSRYGVVLETRPYWEHVITDTVTVKVNNRLPVRLVADWTGTVYANIMHLNPELVSDGWGPGTYLLKIPEGTRKKFLEGLGSLRKKK